MDEIEKAFQETTSILFGKKLYNLEDYRTWLLESVGKALYTKSQISNNTVYVPDIIFYSSIKKNMVTLDESVELGKRQLSEEDTKILTLANASEKLKDIKFVTSDVMLGQNQDLKKTSTYMNAQHCFDGVWYINSKCDAYCFWPRESEYCFGSHFIFASNFSIKCYNSVKLARCFELSDCSTCTDCYFCHNCENLNNCMFCFNVKSLRYAIGNIEVGRETYLKIKEKIIGEIANKIETEKKLEMNIYNIGCTFYHYGYFVFPVLTISIFLFLGRYILN
ncbi:MAG: hypothetical protein ABID61_04155 [Candidatus Micrarchaeota archaeon]